MNTRIVPGLREEFREVSDSGYVYFNFGDETVSPLDSDDMIPAGGTYKIEADHGPVSAGMSIWRGELSC